MERWCEVATGPGSARSVREASATRRDAARERLEEKALRRAAKAADNAGLSNKASTASGIVTKSMITEEVCLLHISVYIQSMFSVQVSRSH